MEFSSRQRVVIAVFLSLIVVGSTFVITLHLLDKNSGTSTGIPMSNVTVNMSISPSSVPATASGTGSYNFYGALIEIWPVYHAVSRGPSYQTDTNVSPMVMLWINNSWSSSFRLPSYFISIENDWKEYFGDIRDGSTSLTAVISYYASDGSSTDLVYTQTSTLPYNPFTVMNGSVMHFILHPDLRSTLYFTVPANETPVLNTPVYGNSPPATAGTPSPDTSNGILYSPDRLPYPGGGSNYWAWKQISSTSFVNANIPISYINATKKNLNANVDDSVFMGSTTYETEFSMAKGYDYSGTKSYSMGTSAVYTSGLVVGLNNQLTYFGKNLTRYDGVLAINGNATITRYRWVDYGPNVNVIATSNNYSTDASITSLNEAGNQFHISGYWAGYINLNKYNNSTFKHLTLQQKYQQAFGIYFNGSDSHALWGNPDEISSITDLNVGGTVLWSTIYASITATTSNVEGEISSAIGLLISLAGVGLALAAFPYGDSVDVAALFVSLVGFGVSVGSLFESGVLTVNGDTFLYGGNIKNEGNSTGGSSVSVYNWYTPADISVNGNSYQFPTNYAIIK